MDRLVPFYRALVETGTNFQGLSILPHTRVILKLINATNSKTLLDYGCGKGDQWEKPYCLGSVLGVPKAKLYDPAFPTHDVLPEGTFDGVLCSDVLEHVPEDELNDLIKRLFDYADNFVWASVCCRPAKKLLPDGQNMHVTIQPMRWWRDKFQQHCKGKMFGLTETF